MVVDNMDIIQKNLEVLTRDAPGCLPYNAEYYAAGRRQYAPTCIINSATGELLYVGPYSHAPNDRRSGIVGSVKVAEDDGCRRIIDFVVQAEVLGTTYAVLQRTKEEYNSRHASE